MNQPEFQQNRLMEIVNNSKKVKIIVQKDRKNSMQTNQPTILNTNKNNLNANGFIIPASSSVLEPAT